MKLTLECPAAVELEAWQCGALSEPRAAEVSEHLDGCSACLQSLRDLTNSKDSLVEAMRSLGGSQREVRELAARKDVQQALIDAEAHLETLLNYGVAEGRERPEMELRRVLGASESDAGLGDLGSYRLKRVLGRGGMGIVAEAEDATLQRRVAVKILRSHLAAQPNAAQRFLREARSAAKIEHPHIVPIFHIGEERGIPFLVMPLLRGRSLQSELAANRSLPIADAVRWARETAEGLAAAHAQGLVHRDIKPANIWLETAASGAGPAHVRILDFGLARSTDDVRLTATGDGVGTPHFMSPEQVDGQPVDARTDLFSLGVTLYRLLTGKLPFRGTTILEAFRSLAVDTPLAPAAIDGSIPKPLSDLVVRMIDRDPARRPESAKEVVDALVLVEKTIAEEAARLTADPLSNPRKPRRAVLVAVGLGLAAVVAMIVGQIVLRITDREGKTRDIVLQPGDKIEVLPNVVDKKPPASLAETTNSLGMKLVYLPSGKFMMGSPSTEKGRSTDEDEHEVEISKGFWLGKYEVTQREFESLMGSNLSLFKGADLPVERVTWFEAKEFCQKLSKKEGKEYTLPTEAEWEYACRGGTKTPFSTGGNLTTNQANYNGDKPYAENAKGARREKTLAVGGFAPNAFGLHEMHGNVAEWCEDWYGPAFYKESPFRDPKGAVKSSLRIVRGGSYKDDASSCRSSNRFWNEPTSRNPYLGFRVVRRSVE